MKRYSLIVVLLIISIVVTSCVHSWPLAVFGRQPIESRVGDLFKPWRWIFTRKDEDEGDQQSDESGPREMSQPHTSLPSVPLQFQLHHQQAYQTRPSSLEPGTWFSLGDQVFYFPLAQEWAW